MIIKQITAKKIKTSIGKDSIKVVIKTDKAKGFASVPIDKETKYSNKEFIENIDESIKLINNLKDLINLEINNYQDLIKIEEILRKYDSTDKWEKIGGNILLVLQLAMLNTLSLNSQWKAININSKKVPRPIGICISGKNSSLNENSPDFKEFLTFSLDCTDIDKAIYANLRIYNLMRKYIRKQDKTFNYEIGFKGGWSTSLSNLEILELLNKIRRHVSKEMNFNIELGINVSAQNLFDGKNYIYKNYSKEEKEKILSKEEQIKLLINLAKKYDIKYLEDPLYEEDFKGYTKILKSSEKLLVVGNLLTSTNISRLKKAIKEKAINSVIIKSNQISSLIELKKFIELAKENNIYLIISSSLNETMDTSISHLASGFELPLLKTGIYGNEQTIKLEELQKIRRQIKLNLYK